MLLEELLEELEPQPLELLPHEEPELELDQELLFELHPPLLSVGAVTVKSITAISASSSSSVPFPSV